VTIKLYILGSGGSYPPPGFSGPCILIEHPHLRLLVDPGEGCLSKLMLKGFTPCSIDLIYVSHIHADHWIGLHSLSVARIAENCPFLSLWAPTFSDDDLVILRKILPSNINLKQLKINKLDISKTITIETIPVAHTVQTRGLIIESHKSRIFYAADTKADHKLYNIKYPVDVLIGEATFPSNMREYAAKKGHMSVTDLFHLAKHLGAKIVVPVHLSPYSLSELIGMERKMREPEVLIGEGLEVVLP
jgi:ribonuclease Z